MPQSYERSAYPEMEGCAGSFRAETEGELWRHIELHAVLARHEDPDRWSEDERTQIRDIIRPE